MTTSRLLLTCCWKYRDFSLVPPLIEQDGAEEVGTFDGSKSQNFRLPIWSNGMEEQRHQCRKEGFPTSTPGEEHLLPANRRWKWKREASHYVVFSYLTIHSPYLLCTDIPPPYCPKLHPGLLPAQLPSLGQGHPVLLFLHPRILRQD